MHSACRASVLLILFLCPALMRAVTIKSQDPTYDNITYTPYTFRFFTCSGSGVYSGGQPVTDDGCYVAENETGADITSITLTFQDTAQIDATPQNALSTFFRDNTASCANGLCVFSFTDGDLPDNSLLLLTEDGVTDPEVNFPLVTFAYTTATPEPVSVLLLTTGLGSLGALCRRRRRA